MHIKLEIVKKFYSDMFEVRWFNFIKFAIKHNQKDSKFIKF